MLMYDVISALAKWLPGRVGVECRASRPNPAPDELVTVERTGGERGVGVDRPSLAVQCWSTSDAGAYTLALATAEAIAASWQDLPEVCSATVGSIYRFPDPDTRRPRYQIDVYMTTRA